MAVLVFVLESHSFEAFDVKSRHDIKRRTWYVLLNVRIVFVQRMFESYTIILYENLDTFVTFVKIFEHS